MIFELLAIGQENARTAKELATVLGCDARDITTQIEKERRQGLPICASCNEHKGYYLAADADELEAYCNRLHHRAGEMYKTRAALLNVLKQIKEAKEAAENGQSNK